MRELRLRFLFVGTFVFIAVGAACAFGDAAGADVPGLPTSQEIIQAIGSKSSQSIGARSTDTSAAEGVPHSELGRNEALELLQGVFEPELQGPAGIFDDLHVEKFLADNVAVISAGQQPGDSTPMLGEKASYNGPTLINSTVPLRTEAPSGKVEAIDLSLEHASGELQPANALVEVGIPTALGEGIELPGAGIRIELPEGPQERAPSTVDKSVGFFPNVAPDTDLAVAPTPTGVETLTQLRSAESPRSQTFILRLPPGASLQTTKDGGAKVVKGEETLLGIAPPTALDAAGAAVPVSLSVSDDSLTLTVAPPESAQFPILVDPLYQTYEWMAKNTSAGINGNSYGEQWSPERIGANWTLQKYMPYSWGPLSVFQAGIYVGIGSNGSPAAGNQAAWLYTVPRYFSESPKPTSFISHMTLSDLYWKTGSGGPSPYLVAGLWDPNIGWVSVYSHEGREGHNLTDLTWPYQFPNPNGNQNVKLAWVGQQATETRYAGTFVYVGAATVELADTDNPSFGSISSPPQWVNQTASSPVGFTVSDAGLGVYSLTAADEQSPQHSWKTLYGCTGVAGSPCPRTWKSPASPALKYDPSVLPQGIDYINVTAEDPLGHASTATVQVKVDHTAPELMLSGSLTEQASVGTSLTHYKLKLIAADGTQAIPQSGAASTEIKVDGKRVDSFAPGCATRNCTLEHEWTYNSYAFAAGKHTVEAIVTDGAGIATSKTISIESPGPLDTMPPALALSGSLTEQATLGTALLHYTLKLNATDGTEASPQAGVVSTEVKLDGNRVDWSSPGCATQNCAIAREWTLDSTSYAKGPHTVEVTASDAIGLTSTKSLTVELRPDTTAPAVSLSGSMTEQDGLGAARPRYSLKVEAADEAAQIPIAFPESFGSEGSEEGQLESPSDIAVDPGGDIWVADSGNNRVEKFSAEGQYLEQIGPEGWWGQLSNPEGIAIDSEGTLWVADTSNQRVARFTSSGEYIEGFEVLGLSPTGVVAVNGGDLRVTFAEAGCIAKFDEEGALLASSCELGSPRSIAVNAEGNLWVTDAGNGRLEKLNARGELLREVGAEEQFDNPTGITVDPDGDVWITESGNDRVEKFNAEGDYLGEIGSEGAGKDQFIDPYGIASDPEGNLWVVDSGNDRVQKGDWHWTQPEVVAPSGVATTTIKVDGKVVDSNSPGCPGGGCSISREWSLESSAYSAGKHTVEAIATDVAGNVTTRTLSVEIQRDTIKPTLKAGGELLEAPEGWVEQESYGLNATATDAGGYGVTSLAFKIDAEQVASATKSCPDGGCEETLSKPIDMSPYSGGAHAAEIVATDGAGNVTTRKWTINVDPEGHISTEEAEDTLEAVDATSESTVVAPTDQVLESEQLEGGDNPGLEQNGPEITSTGVPDTTTMTIDPGEGFMIHSPDGSTTITPIVGEHSSPVSIAEGVAGVSANIGNEVDGVIRPEYNGVQTFQAIRAASSPETYSWRVNLDIGQTLHLANSSQADVVYEDGRIAFLITAEQAHDATGKPVPTSLEVNGPTITLKVNFRSDTFVYPIVAGQGWETSYKVPVTVEGPEDETQIREREEHERAMREAAEAGEEAAPPLPPPGQFSISEAENMLEAGAVEEIIPAPEPAEAGGGATASSVPEKTVKPFRVCQQDSCSNWHVELKNPSYFYKHNGGNHWTSYWEPGTQVHYSWWYPWYFAPELTVDGNGCGFVGPGQVWSGEQKHLTIWSRYTIQAVVVTPDGDALPFVHYLALQIWVWPNGYQQRKQKDWDPGVEEA